MSRGAEQATPGMEVPDEAPSLGMWTFLATEVLFFGGLFAAYTVYRITFSGAFIEASKYLYLWIGAVNTIVLLLSSLSMALAVHASSERRRGRLVICLVVTGLLGTVFLGLKGLEYYLDYREGVIPGTGFRPHGAVEPGQEQMFFILYFLMTGLHAIHLIIAVGLVASLALLALGSQDLPSHHNKIENVGLYWHFVDIVWVYLFPLLYLVG